MGLIGRMMFKAIEVIKPEEGTASLTQDLLLVPGRAVPGVVLAPGGKPISGVLVNGLQVDGLGHYEKLDSNRFTVKALAPEEARMVLFYDPHQELGAMLEIPGGTMGPITVRLQPCASASGRLVDGNGDPVAETTIEMCRRKPILFVGAQTWTGRTGKDGTFRISGLIPALDYVARVKGKSLFTVNLKPGEIHNAGTIRLDPKTK
jgi:hypothetical protein